MRWVAEYERAWRDGDVSGVARLFTESARYRVSPYAEPKVGHAEIQAFWLDDRPGRTFTVTAEPVAVDGRDACGPAGGAVPRSAPRSTGTCGSRFAGRTAGPRTSRSGRTGRASRTPRDADGRPVE